MADLNNGSAAVATAVPPDEWGDPIVKLAFNWGDDPIVKPATDQAKQYAQQQLGGAPAPVDWRKQVADNQDYYLWSASDKELNSMPADVQEPLRQARSQITPEIRKQRELQQQTDAVRAYYEANPEHVQSDRFVKSFGSRVPFLRSYLNATETNKVAESARRFQKGEYTREDVGRLAQFQVAMEAATEEDKQKPWYKKAAGIVADMVPYAIEFAATSGAYSTARTGAMALTKSALGGAAETLAGRIATATIPRVAGVAAQSAANPAMVAESTAQQQLSSVLAGNDQSFLQAMPAGVVDVMSQLGSERAGGMIGKLAGKLVPSQIKSAIAEAWMAQTGRGIKKLTENIASATGWNGIVGELGEERVGEIISGIFGKLGVGNFDFGTTGKLAAGDPEGLKQLGIEAAAFAAPGLASAAAQVGAGAAERLTQLKAIRGKGFVSEQDGKDLGMTPEELTNRASRKAAVDQRIQETQQEIERASTVRSTQGEVRQEQGGPNLRGQGQEQVRTQPAGEVAPPPEVQPVAPAAAVPQEVEPAPAEAVPEATPQRSKLERDADRVVKLDSRIDALGQGPERDAAIALRDQIRGKHDAAEFDATVNSLVESRKAEEKQKIKDRKSARKTPEHKAVVARGRIQKTVDKMRQKGATEAKRPPNQKPLGNAVWTTEDGIERPVVVSHVSGLKGDDVFVGVEGSDTSIPLSQVRFEGEAVPAPEVASTLSPREKAQQGRKPEPRQLPPADEAVAAAEVDRIRRENKRRGRKDQPVSPQEAPTQPQNASEAQPAPEVVPQPETLQKAAQEPKQPKKRPVRKPKPASEDLNARTNSDTVSETPPKTATTPSEISQTTRDSDTVSESPALTFDQYSAQRGVPSTPPSFPETHRTPRRPSKASMRSTGRRIANELDAWQERRDALRKEYDAKIESGEIRQPTRRERLERTAQGTGDQAEAARRLLAKSDQPKVVPSKSTGKKKTKAKKPLTKQQQASISRLRTAAEGVLRLSQQPENKSRRRYIDNDIGTIVTHASKLGIDVPQRSTYYNQQSDIDLANEVLSKLNEKFEQQAVSGEASKPRETPKRRVGAPKKRPGKPITKESLQEVFPGCKVTPAPGGWAVEIGDTYFTVHVTDKMPAINWDAAEKSIGRKVSQAERAQIQAAGATSLEFPDGTKHDGLGLILLHESLADDKVLRHEAVHLARQAGILGKAEWDALVDAHARGATDENVQEERVAQAMEAVETDTRLWSLIQSWIRRLLANLGITDYQARDVHQLLRSSGFWGRAAAPEARTTRYALRGRPDLANPATEEEARRLVDDVDEARNQRGLPEHRADADVEQAATERLERNYEGERDKLIQAGRSGEQLLDVDTIIAKKIINREASDAIQSDDAKRIADAMAIIESYRNTGSEQGRAFRQRRDPVETPAERMARVISEAILEPPQKQREKRNRFRRDGNHEAADKINEEWAKKVRDLKERLKTLGVDLDNLWEHGYSRRKAASVLATIQQAKASGWDKAYEYWRNSILSLPTTQVANVVGNVGHAGWHFTAERLTEALVNTVAQRPEAAQMGEIKHVLAAILPCMSEGARNFLTTWKMETPTFEASIGREGQWRIEDPNVAIGGKAGRAIRWPQRLLLAVDDYAKTMFTRMEVAAYAYRIAKAEGVSGKALTTRMQELTLDQESAAWDKAYDSALELTFQQKGTELTQTIKRNVLAARNDLPGLRYIATFVTTPVNIFATGIKKSPLGTLAIPAKMYQNYQEGRHVLHGLPANMAQQVLAWALVLALMGNDEDDPWITGAESESTPQKREVSFRSAPAMSVKIGDTWHSYSRVEPFATSIGLTVDFVNALRSGDAKRMIETPLTTLRGQIGGKTFLSGIGDILDAVQEEEISKGIAQWFSNFATSWVPNLVRGAGREASDYYENRRVWGTRGEWFERLGKRTLQKTELPLFQEYPIYDVWGRPATRSETGLGAATDWLYRITVPSRIQKDETFVADRLILNYNNQNPEDERFPLAPRPYYRSGDETIYMSDGQYAELAKLSGEAARASLDGVPLNVDRPTVAAVDLINDAVSNSRSAVRDELEKRWAGEDVSIDPEAIGKETRTSMMQNIMVNATYLGENEKELATRDKNVGLLQALKDGGLTFAEANQLLLDHYKAPTAAEAKANKVGGITPAETKSYLARQAKLEEIYGE